MSHGTGNKDLSYDGNPGLHNFQFCFSKSNSYLLLPGENLSRIFKDLTRSS